ncbi:hypothetical protein BZY95_09480 [Billgrantia desiderata SP1]|uniref:DUF418 domain-containing protein n=1 Tax=Billgrantia desiderata TaxID=52021 RepID=UPI000A3794DC|nr:DUF418 domain-containing protein [Halomonas desiderata]OUE42732.1 hypothetical protein BZY95_09480 [Halomonas desiderata SP1]
MSRTRQACRRADRGATARIEALDVLRGVALLGILVMNVQAFAMPQAAYLNPTAWGRLEGIDLAVWLTGHVLADQKMMALFAMLFGAGIVLNAERTEAAGKRAWPLHSRRHVWLMLFGIAHAYLLWYGDILFTFAVCALALFPLRHLAPSRQLALGVVLVAVTSLLFLAFDATVPAWSEEDRQTFMAEWQPSAAQLASEVERYRSGWWQQLPQRAEMAFEMQTFTLLIWGLWRSAGLMLIGMALFRWGILTGQASRRTYLSLLAVALLLGVPMILYGVHWNFANDWGPRSMFVGTQFNYWGSVLVAFGWVSVVMLLLRANVMGRLRLRLAAVGRTALSQYILQSVICSLIFYGHGLGMFGHIERSGQMLVVLGIWLLQLWLAPLWLRHFRYGPLEWLWRSLTRGQRQPWRP